MKQKQIARLRSSFELIESLGDAVPDGFYKNLFALAPELEERFANVDMSTQGRMVIQAVGIVVNGLDDQDALRTTLGSLGYRHSNYGVQPEHYDVAVEALLATFRELLGEQFDSDLEDTWRQMLVRVTMVMVEGGRAIADEIASKAAQFSAGPKASTTLDDYLARFISGGDPGQDRQFAEPVLEDLPKTVTVEFVGEGRTRAAPLQSILDASLAAGIAHVCECGGKAKCTTCRVVVLEGLRNCLPRNQPETRMAQIKGFPPELRLACQTRMVGPVKVKRLVHDSADVSEVISSGRSSAGREMTLAVLFSDIRGFTAFAEGNLPYDIVHALNRYFNAIGQAIDENGGYIDKYMGDGIMALFGLNPYREEHPCLDAVTAALGMLSSLRGVNDYMSAHLGHEFTIGIGIHYGTVVVGEIGFKLRKQFTAIGDTVNLAARLESETKNLEADILVSDQVRRELPPGSCRFGHSVELTLKGKSGLYKAHELLTRSGES